MWLRPPDLEGQEGKSLAKPMFPVEKGLVPGYGANLGPCTPSREPDAPSLLEGQDGENSLHIGPGSLKVFLSPPFCPLTLLVPFLSP